MTTLFENIVLGLHVLNEDAQIENISDAVVNMHPVSIRYDDNNGGGGKNKRIIYPVAYGISTAGNPVVRAFQKHGSTKTFSPHWKLFRLDRIKNWRVIRSKKFDESELVGFNKDGDEQIETLYSISPIGNAAKMSLNRTHTPLTTKPITKIDVKAESDPEFLNTKQEKDAKKDVKTAKDIVNGIVSQIDNREEDSVDNKRLNGYNTKKWQEYKMNATDDNPIYQNEIPGGNNSVSNNGDEDKSDEPQAKIGNDPISKSDLSIDTEDEKKKNPASDLIDRMDGLHNDNEI